MFGARRSLVNPPVPRLVRQPSGVDPSPVSNDLPILLDKFEGAFLTRSAIQSMDVEPVEGLGELHSEEVDFLDGRSPRRQRELVAGRRALRSALKAAGWTGFSSLLPDSQGRPRVPDGFTGSITHKDGLALAVAAPLVGGRTLGVDSEVVGTRDRSAIARKILRPEELDHWTAGGARWPDLLVIFSMKEAIYKALHPHVPRYIAFEEAEVRPDGTIRMHLAGGEGPFEVRGTSTWEGDRLLSVVQARPDQSRG